MIKIARSHLLNAIEYALQISGPVTYTYPRYILEATPYRLPSKKGNFGVRVTWHEIEKEAKTKTAKKKKKARA